MNMKKFLNSLLSVKFLVWLIINFLLLKKYINSSDYVILTLGFLGIRSFDQYYTSRE